MLHAIINVLARNSEASNQKDNLNYLCAAEFIAMEPLQSPPKKKIIERSLREWWN